MLNVALLKYMMLKIEFLKINNKSLKIKLLIVNMYKESLLL